MSDRKAISSIDVTKLIMAILVISIHTQPFRFNIWMDRGLGIITRTCVPFFFAASAYFFWKKDGNSALRYIKRIFLIYVIWSLIYLPFDIDILKNMSFTEILKYYLWLGNGHELWYLMASIVSFLLVYLFLKVLKPQIVLIISLLVLIVGCLGSTWSPVGNGILTNLVVNQIGYRNGLFYGFPYMALGMFLAKYESRWSKWTNVTVLFGLLISLGLLIIESFIFIVHFSTGYTVLWISVVPLTFFLFIVVNRIPLKIPKTVSVFIRNMSTLVYVSQSLFLMTFVDMNNLLRFILVSFSAVLFSVVIVYLSRYKYLRFLKYLY